MVAHVVFPTLDSLPATLSRRITTGLLRDELGFDGVITTDALDMQAVRARWGLEGAAVKALIAGADMLLLGSEDGEGFCREIRRLVKVALDEGELELEQLERSAERVRALAAWARPVAPEDVSQAVGLEAARRAVAATGSVPLSAAPYVLELRGETNFAVGWAHWSLAEPLAALDFLAGAAAVTPETVDLPALPDAPLVVAVRDAYRVPWQRAWVERLRAERPELVLVGMGLPYDRELAGDSFVATYGAAQVNARAGAELLSGRR
jgi:beta-N-acetylhexosaminidase